jgi:hypothetical protein
VMTTIRRERSLFINNEDYEKANYNEESVHAD